MVGVRLLAVPSSTSFWALVLSAASPENYLPSDLVLGAASPEFFCFSEGKVGRVPSPQDFDPHLPDFFLVPNLVPSSRTINK